MQIEQGAHTYPALSCGLSNSAYTSPSIHLLGLAVEGKRRVYSVSGKKFRLVNREICSTLGNLPNVSELEIETKIAQSPAKLGQVRIRFRGYE